MLFFDSSSLDYKYLNSHNKKKQQKMSLLKMDFDGRLLPLFIVSI